jgi:triacylglycerol esterase/lipase EstA (alpha/beta hydrolase family)
MTTAGEKSSPHKVTQGLEVLYSGEKDNVTIDIIAVPGLGSNPDTAFDSFHNNSDGKTQFNWLTDDNGLRFDFPTARILLYKSESRWIKDAAVNQSMRNLASNLLTSIMSKREGITARPIIFVGHSMGGLVVAKAVTLAAYRVEEYPNLLSCITGCLFFGTPFHGSAAAGKATMLAELLQKVNQAAVSRVLTFLLPENEALQELRTDFVRICNRLDPPIGNVCFYEQRKTDYTKGIWKAVGLAKVRSSRHEQFYGGLGLIAYS